MFLSLSWFYRCQSNSIPFRFRRTNPKFQAKHVATFKLHQKKAGMYYAYDAIYKYIVSYAISEKNKADWHEDAEIRGVDMHELLRDISFQDQPFTPFMSDALFNISKFLVHELMTDGDKPISKLYVNANANTNIFVA